MGDCHQKQTKTSLTACVHKPNHTKLGQIVIFTRISLKHFDQDKLIFLKLHYKTTIKKSTVTLWHPYYAR